MNLVAKEFCASRVDDGGVLVLSEFAGAAKELKCGALLVNPYDTEGVASRALPGISDERQGTACAHAEDAPLAPAARRLPLVRFVLLTGRSVPFQRETISWTLWFQFSYRPWLLLEIEWN